MAGANQVRTPDLRISLGDPRFVLLAIGAVVLALFPYFGHAWGQTYLVSLVAKMLIFAVAAVSLDLILGYGGMVSFGHAAYIGLGAYAVAVFSKYGVDNGYLQLVCAVAGSALIALFIGAISLRTSGVYFIMITLAFTQMLYYLGISLEPFGGDDGMNTRRSDFSLRALGFDFTLNDNLFVCEKRTDKVCKVDDRDGAAIYYAAYITLIASVWFTRRIVASRFGMVIRGAMSNPIRMQAIGFPIYRYRLTAFVLAGTICGVAGFLFANHQQFLSPVYMNWIRSGDFLIMVILGGVGTIYGAVIGAIGFLTIEELLEGYVGKDYWQMVMGPLLVVLVLFANRGIYSLIPHELRKVPMFVVKFALVLGGMYAFIWLMSKTSPILKIAGNIPHLPLYVIFASLLVALGLRFLQESRARHGETILGIEHLTKRFGGLTATNDLSLDVEKGEVHAIIGPNGAGKTTLIAQLSGLLAPDSGRILFKGQDITALPAHTRSAIGLARSFQVTSIFLNFTAEDNVALAVQAHAGHSFRFVKPARAQAVLREPARKALASVGLEHRAEIVAADLSHGEQRQLEIAMAIATNPTLLLLDEPMAGMGPEESTRMVDVLKKFKGTHTLLLIEHDMDAVFKLADRITVLVYGTAIATGTPEAIRANPEVKRAYLGDEA